MLRRPHADSTRRSGNSASAHSLTRSNDSEDGQTPSEIDTGSVSDGEGPAVHAVVAHALGVTREAGPLPFLFEVELRFPMSPKTAPARRPSLASAVLHALAAPLRSLGEKALRVLLTRRRAEGILDLANDRYMMDFGSYAMLVVGSQRWSGRSGRAVATLPEDDATMWDPPWLLALLEGVTAVDALGTEFVHGSWCRRFAVRADFARAADATSTDLLLPPGQHYSDLVGVPLDLWLDDDGRIRRVAMRTDLAVLQLDLVEFHVQDAIDWSRLPTFRSKENDE